MISEDIADFEGRMEFLLDTWGKIGGKLSGQISEHNATESISFLLARIRVWRRWIANYNARTKIRIDLFFNLANQSDNHTNLKIAEISKSIAEETRKDSSSMITIAAVTIIFLPATFVSVSLFLNPVQVKEIYLSFLLASKKFSNKDKNN